MFAPLRQYLDQDFRTQNQNIVVATLEGEILFYRIFGTRRTDAWDRIYELGFQDADAVARAIPGAPIGASRFLVLSTCTNSADQDERLLIYAELIQ